LEGAARRVLLDAEGGAGTRKLLSPVCGDCSAFKHLAGIEGLGFEGLQAVLDTGTLGNRCGVSVQGAPPNATRVFWTFVSAPRQAEAHER
jgi:hypothetical protein